MPARKTRSPRRATSRRKTVTRRATTRRVTKTNRPWSREEVSFMRKYYRRFETAWCARQMGRTVYSVRYKAVDLGIKKASPSIWRGNRGTVNAFKACCKGSGRTITRKTSTRKTTKRTWRATSKRRTTRRTIKRRR